jgi:inhibitor of cysteine peptidase
MLSGCKVISWLSGTGEYSTWGRTSDNPAASEEPSDAIEPSPAAAAVPTIVSDTYAYNSQYIRSSVEMPVVSGLSDTAAQDKINAAFKAYGDKAKADITRMETECRELVEQNPGLDMVYELMAAYRVDYNKNGLLCVTLSGYYYQGGAHGGEQRSSYIFDLATGDRLGLEDLMKDGSDYRSFINAAIRQEIDKRVKENILYEIADFEDIGQTPDFYLSDSALVFYFQEYAYFPYAAGIQEFSVAYTDLAGYLNGAYALG